LPGHPESPARFDFISELKLVPFAEQLLMVEAKEPTDEVLTRVHRWEYLAALKEAMPKGPGFLDHGDTYFRPESEQASRTAVGGLLALLDRVLQGEMKTGFALVRPPGHHATASRALGFCLMNNIAVAARAARDEGVGRILIVDFDVHHGNGTQDIFERDPGVVYFSTHQAGIFPGTGHIQEIGKGEAEGTNVNVPLPAASGDKAFSAVFNDILLPIGERFKPDLILVSAGFDAHWSDPLANLQLTKSGYYHLAQSLVSLARAFSEGRILFTLEGGYNPSTLKECVEMVLYALADVSPPEVPSDSAPYPEPSVHRVIEQVRGLHSL
jgi:acetoin utilization deacetylase AcuC-like enzyme